MSPAKLTALKLLPMPLPQGRRHRAVLSVRLQPLGPRCMREVCYSAVWVVDAPCGVFSAEYLSTLCQFDLSNQKKLRSQASRGGK